MELSSPKLKNFLYYSKKRIQRTMEGIRGAAERFLYFPLR